jgi:hypothetical protein
MEFFRADPNNRSSVLKQIYQWGVYDEKLKNFAKLVKEDGRYLAFMHTFLYSVIYVCVMNRMCTFIFTPVHQHVPGLRSYNILAVAVAAKLVLLLAFATCA